MGVLATFTSVEEVRLNVAHNGEQAAASGVRGRVHAIGAGDTTGECRCKRRQGRQMRRLGNEAQYRPSATLRAVATERVASSCLKAIVVKRTR